MRLSAIGSIVLLLAFALSGCSQTKRHTPPTRAKPSTVIRSGSPVLSIVIGVAEPCRGGGGLGPPPPVTVIAREHERIVSTSVALRSDHYRYQLALAPGRYTLSAPKSVIRPERVLLRYGERLTVNFLPTCG